MKLFGIEVPTNEYWLAKDIATVIYNKERKLYFGMSDQTYMMRLSKIIRQRYKKEKGTKTLIEILKEYRAELRKKEDI